MPSATLSESVVTNSVTDLCAESSPTRRTWMLAVTVWLAVACVGLMTGPHLGDHEVIVAQTARQMLESGDWLVPQYLDTPFLVKPPLAPWLVAAFSQFLPRHTDGLPVTTLAARLPSVIASALTILVVLRLARSMYGRRTAFVAATACGSAVGTLLFAFNATAEALLAFFCTWALAEFWWAHEARTRRARVAHLALFYIALGLGMLAKGPMPLALVAVPLALWWWLDRPARILAAGGFLSGGRSARRALSDAMPRLLRAVRGLGLWWGAPLFLAMFVPWMVLVARHESYAWQLWDYEYLDRLRGRYPGCRGGNYLYYVPIVLGLVAPWTLSMPEALVAPFLGRFTRQRRALTYAWFWVVGGAVIVSLMSFKKSHYVVPLVPGAALLLAPVLERFFYPPRPPNPVAVKRVTAVVAALLTVGAVIGWFFAQRAFPEVWHGRPALLSPLLAAGVLSGAIASGVLFLRGRRTASFCTVGAMAATVFALGWALLGPALDNVDAPLDLVRRLAEARVPAQADLYWVSNRPDGRLTYYGGRQVRHVVDPYRLIAQHRWKSDTQDLQLLVGTEICNLLERPKPVYVVFEREQFELFKAFCRPPAHELFSIDRGDRGHDSEDWVVVTNVPDSPAM